MAGRLTAWSVARAPGLAVTAAVTAAAFVVHRIVPGLHPGTLAVAAGAVAVNLGLIRPRLGPGLAFASKKLLRIAVALLGFALSLGQVAELGVGGLLVVVGTVAVAFGGTIALGRLLRVPRATGLLVATGFSICGASAVAAMEPLAKGKRDDTAMSIALITLCGSLAIVVLPLLRHPLGLDDADIFGQWVGASVHDVGQTVATANVVPGALETAVIVKLSRVILLAPLVFLVGLAVRRAGRWSQSTDTTGAQRRPPLVPLFVAAFVAAIGVNTFVPLPGWLLEWVSLGQQILLTAALFALGTGIHWAMMRRAGGRALVLGLLSWVLVAGVAYAGVMLIA